MRDDREEIQSNREDQEQELGLEDDAVYGGRGIVK